MTSLGLVDTILGQRQRAIERHQQALVLYRQLGDKHSEAHSLSADFVYADIELNLHCDMVVLSACNTARGETRTGDGLIGLTWALFVAGAPTQVVSQWSVDDASTALLMQRFYANLTQGHMQKGTALRAAALSLLNGSRKSKIQNTPIPTIGRHSFSLETGTGNHLRRSHRPQHSLPE